MNKSYFIMCYNKLFFSSVFAHPNNLRYKKNNLNPMNFNKKRKAPIQMAALVELNPAKRYLYTSQIRPKMAFFFLQIVFASKVSLRNVYSVHAIRLFLELQIR